MSLFPLTAVPSHLLPFFSLQHEPNTNFIVLRSLWIHMNIKQTTLKSAWVKHAQSSAMVINIFLTFIQSQQRWQNDTFTTKSLIKSLHCGLFLFRYYFKVQAKNVFGLGPFSDTLTYVTESGVYPVNACKDKLRDALLTTCQPSVKLALIFCTAACKKNVMVTFVVLQCKTFKYKTILAVKADYQMYSALRALWVFHSQNQVNALTCSAACVLFLPCEMIAFFLSDDPLLIERPPGKSIHWLHVFNLRSTSHILPKLLVLKREP